MFPGLCRLMRAAEDGRSVLPSILEGGIENFVVGLRGYCMLNLVFINNTFSPVTVPRLATVRVERRKIF